MAKGRDLVIGFDLGGTKMMAAVVDGRNRILYRCRKRTEAEKGGKALFQRIVATIEEAIQKSGVKPSEVRGIGVGSPGPLDPDKGVILDTPNLGFRNFPLRARLEKRFGAPAAVDNDVNMGTYGEFHFGAARGFKHVIGIFPGTGIGGGLILDGKLFRGASGNAGELGHIILQTDGPLCGCGQRGCLEALASRLSLAKEIAAVAARGGAPTIRKDAGADLTKIKSGVIARAFKAGDPDVQGIVLRSARYLGIAMANFVHVLSPDAIVLGGGLVEALPDRYVKEAVASMKEHAFAVMVKDVKVLVAELGDDAVVMGASKLIREKLDGRAK